jgi:hypothetical protein
MAPDLIEERFNTCPQIPLSEVREWMKSRSLHERGCLFGFLTRPQESAKIEPRPDLAEVDAFVQSYLRDCIEINPDSEWTDSSYEAAWAICNWIRWLRRDPENDDLVSGWVKLLEELIGIGDSRVRSVIVNGTLEHLFQEKRLRKLFAHWQKDPSLRAIFEEAMLWSTESERLGIPSDF